MTPNSLDTIKNLTEAINKGDIETALSFYHDQAVMISQPGSMLGGKMLFAQHLKDSYH